MPSYLFPLKMNVPAYRGFRRMRWISDLVSGRVPAFGWVKPADAALCPTSLRDIVPERSRFTDDTVLTVATAQALFSGEPYDRA